MHLQLSAVFSDQMVVQRDMPVPMWGTAAKGAEIEATVDDGAPAHAVADDSGKWRLSLAAMPAGGPHTITARSGEDVVRMEDVLVGEVWLASGQSNMAFTMPGVLDAEREMAAADYPQIRMFTVDTTPAREVQSDCGGRWHLCTPSNIHGFSGVAYYFAREIHAKLGVPVGVLDSSVGGTTAEAWTPLEALASSGECANLAAAGEEFRVHGDLEETAPHDDPGISEKASDWSSPELDVHDWPDMRLPAAWQNEGLNYNGAVWFRRDVEVPREWSGRELVLSLGAIDDFDISYFNGAEVGRTGSETAGWWTFPRKYTIDASLVRDGRNTIAVRVFDQWCSGGIIGEPGAIWLAPADDENARISLTGPWKYNIELELPMRTLSTGSHPASLYNGMIAPLVPYGIKGALWYQGESNADRAQQYRALLKLLIRSWRSAWKQEHLAFLIVQLADFGAVRDEPQQSSWAELREAQAMALAEPDTGMAVAIDVGDPDDVHPKNKRDVGLRLALCAEKQVYGLDVVAGGPRMAGLEIDGACARVRFTSVADGLVARDGPLRGFALAGKDRKFAWADAAIEGDSVVLKCERVPNPVAVRYAWADSPVCNLYNSAGLPAEPFRTDKWPGVTSGRV